MEHGPAYFLKRTSPPHIATLILLASISALTMNIFLPSLPTMTTYFDTDYRTMQLSVAIYLATSGCLQIVIGPMADRFGRRPVLMIGIGLFLLATLGCLLAKNVWVFLFFRAAQASVSTAMVLSRAIVRDIHSHEKAASVLGYVTMGMSISPMIGPAIGGFLDHSFGWHSVFWTLFGLGAATLFLVWSDLGETAPAKGQPFREQVRDYPELLKSPRFWGYTLACAFCSGAFFAYLGGGPFVGAQIFNLSPAEIGFYLSAPAVGYFWGNFLTGRYAAKVGVNRMVLYGSTICASGVALNLICTLLHLSHELIFFGMMIFVGLGNGLTIPNATSGALSVRPKLAGAASGLGGAAMIGGGAALSAMAGLALKPGSTAAPLLLIMLASAAAGVASIVFVIWRERQLTQDATTKP